MKVASPLIPSSLRLGLTLVILLMIISSPTVMLVNPALVAASLSKESGSIDSAPSTISQEGDFTTQAPLQIPRTLQSTDLVNSLAFYEVTFITSTTGAIDRIRMDFPAGTGVGAAGIIERIGIGGGTLLKSGSSITFDVTSPVSIPAGTFIRLEMFGIKNPINPSVTFTADITTRDSGGNLIDGPSQTNVYTIKKIGSSDLADGAVTTTKIANGAVTGNKIAGTQKLLFVECTHDIFIAEGNANDFFNCPAPGVSPGDQVLATYNEDGTTQGGSPGDGYVSVAEPGSDVVTIVLSLRDFALSDIQRLDQKFAILVFKK